jgi:hypothetical protein
MQIAPNEQRLKQHPSIRVKCASLSKVTESMTESRKHDGPRTSTEPGMQIDLILHSLKQHSSIRVSSEGLSNVIVSDWTPEKQHAQRILIAFETNI